jgi:pseudomonalisin
VRRWHTRATRPLRRGGTHRLRWGVLALAPVAVAGYLTGPAALASLTASHNVTTTPGATAARTGGGATPATAGGTRQVPSVLSGLSLASYLAPAPASQVMTVGVSAQRPDPAAVTSMVQAVYDPASSLYHHFLTPAQFDRQFGLPSSEVSAIEHWMTSAGLKLDSVSGDGSYYLASGTVAELDRLFDVRIGTYRFGGRDFLANDVAPSVPKSLPVDDVLGLDTVQRFTPAPLTGAVSNLPSGTGQGPQAGTEGTLTPQDLWGVYDDPGAGDPAFTDPKTGVSDASAIAATTTDFGQGQTVGIFGEGETSSVIDQLRLFEAAMGLPVVPVRTVYTEGSPGSPSCTPPVSGSTCYGDNTPDVEWYLDSQAVTGMAPDISELDFYFAKSLYDADVFQDFSYWVNDPAGPEEMNASFGECEANPTDPVTGPLAEVPYGTEYGDQLQAVGDPLLAQATIEGRTLFTAAGDTGSGCPELVVPVAGAGNGVAIQPIPDVNYPCTSNFAVCVGGTVVSVNGASYPQASQRVAETSWTFGGGGTSFYYPACEPSSLPAPGTTKKCDPFQDDVANVDMPCIATPQGDPYPPGAQPICRGVPDVSDMSGNVTGDQYFIYIDGKPSGEGGTSLSSPLMVGQWARVQAAASVSVQSEGGLGFADPLIYAQASSADACSGSPTASAAQTAACASTPYAQDFTDVTESEYGIGNGAYQPGPGWDYASGWGPLNVANFIADADCAAQPDGCAPTPRGARYALGNWDHAKGDYRGAILATEAYAGQETDPQVVKTATLDGPQGWSTDPLDQSALFPGPDQAPGGPPVPIPGDNTTPNYDPSLDITGATLTANAGTVTATISGPYLGALPPADAAGGWNSYYVAWLYKGVVYFAQATHSALTGGWSFSSGNTAGGSYSPTANSAATGSVDQSGDTVTIEVPASEVGSPPAGALLADPQAFDQLVTGTPAAGLGLTVDSADDLVPVGDLQSSDCTRPRHRTEGNVTGDDTDAGQQVALCSLAESRGVAVQVQAGHASSRSVSSAPAPLLSVGGLPVPVSVPNPGAGLPALLLPLLPSLGPPAGASSARAAWPGQPAARLP